jgi:hypothetical protein
LAGFDDFLSLLFQLFGRHGFLRFVNGPHRHRTTIDQKEVTVHIILRPLLNLMKLLLRVAEPLSMSKTEVELELFALLWLVVKIWVITTVMSLAVLSIPNLFYPLLHVFKPFWNLLHLSVVHPGCHVNGSGTLAFYAISVSAHGDKVFWLALV